MSEVKHKTNTKNLVIVESPAKAKTIGQYLGKNYKILSSYGHIRDLPKKGLNIDIEHNFAPNYSISPDKKKIVAELKKATKESSEVWLASDEDREGEAIAWHLCVALGLDPKKTKRIVFHEITKKAIEEAIRHPRTVDISLVDAQQARRILDRLVGYELSPVLWKKVRPGLSAGRVQSVAVKLLVEREREISDFSARSSFKITAFFTDKSSKFIGQLLKNIDGLDNADKFLNDSVDAKYKVRNIINKPGARRPGPPFTTSSLQQEAARKLGFGVRQTMIIAQQLYENGYISYMRTDSTVLSSFALDEAKKFIADNYGSKYYTERQYLTRSKSAQEAHEAIRPTNFNILKIKSSDNGQQKLYTLIRERTLASQMSDAQLNKTEIEVEQSSPKEIFIAKGEVLIFDGFLRVYGTTKDDIILPTLNKGQELSIITMTAKEVFTKPPARYSEASLVKKLEELGIGRPSTYAPTISTIQTRGYAEKRDLDGINRDSALITLADGKVIKSTEQELTGADRNKLLPTSVAEITTDFLQKYFGNIIDYDFTAKVEEDFDKIEEGKDKWTTTIDKFYKSFHPLVVKSEDVSRKEVSQARKLGDDPKSGKPIIARFGRYGPMLQRGETESEEKPDFAPLPKDIRLEDVTLENALPMFELPKIVGKTKDGKDITVNIGRFGPYIKVENTFVSIKDTDPFTVTEEMAQRFYTDKLTQISNKYIKEFDKGIKIVNGPYGPYITDGKKNARISKDVKPNDITLEQAIELLKKSVPKKRFRRKK
jgi:DNA topoisomerase-1